MAPEHKRPALCMLFPLLVFGLILFYHPFWGLMDDEVNLDYVKWMKQLGFFTVWWKESVADLFGNGRLRFLYLAMVGLLYGPSEGQSVVTLLLNAALVSGIFFFLGFAYAPSAKATSALKSRSTFFCLFFVFCFAYPWTQHFFLSPSVQEKLVLLFSGLIVFLLYRLKDIESDLRWSLMLAGASILAINTKEQIVMFFPLFLAFQLHLGRKDRRWQRFSILFIFLLTGAALIWWAGTFGLYKKRYGLEGVTATLHASKSIWLFLVLAIAALAAVLHKFWRERDLFALFHRGSYPLGLLLFVVIMAPWGVGHYLNTAALIFVFFSLFYIFEALVPGIFQSNAGFFPLCGAALIATIYTLAPSYSAAGDLGRLIQSEALGALAKENAPINIPCDEGSTRIRQYAKAFSGIDIKVNFPRNSDPNLGAGYWIISPLRCTNGANVAELISSGRAQSLFAGRFTSGFHLLKVQESP